MNGGTEMDVREKSSNGKRLIDADALAVDEQPTIDAVPVIRCRECSKWWQKKDTTWLCRGFGYCTECMIGCYADNYCSYGERKEV